MRFLHLSDLHLGKRVNEFSMLEDQAYILKEILNIIDEQKVEAVLIAGDVYDKVIPGSGCFPDKACREGAAGVSDQWKP